MWLAVLVVACRTYTLDPADTDGDGSEDGSTSTETGAASTCPILGAWEVADAHCGTIEHTEAQDWTVDVAPVEGDLEACDVVIGAVLGDYACDLHVELTDPDADGEVWHGRTTPCEDSPEDLDRVVVGYDGDGALELRFDDLLGCSIGLILEIIPRS